ncbi:MAG TPA: hypothetical protein VFZ21_32205 [Gemmatimonadaceae bacterium]|nr:hypothetical protein [Gemmatimonadaceae bacterium]
MRRLAKMRGAVLGVLFGLVAGCSNPFSGDDETRIRLLNASGFEFTNVTFSSGMSQLEFTRIGPGEATEYRNVEEAYRYGYFDALIDGQRRTIQPIDYVGESTIGDGDFTYVITVDPTTRQPSVALRRD